MHASCGEREPFCTKANAGWRSPHKVFFGTLPPLQVVPFFSPGAACEARPYSGCSVGGVLLPGQRLQPPRCHRQGHQKASNRGVWYTSNVVWTVPRPPLLLATPAPPGEGGVGNVGAHAPGHQRLDRVDAGRVGAARRALAPLSIFGAPAAHTLLVGAGTFGAATAAGRADTCPGAAFKAELRPGSMAGTIIETCCSDYTIPELVLDILLISNKTARFPLLRNTTCWWC